MAQVIRQWLTVVAVLMAIAVNGLSNVFPPAGKNTGEVSNTVLGGVMITPAGYAFAIWGLIYLALIAYSIYQALPTQRSSQAFQKVSWAIIGACVFQMIWIYFFLTYQFWVSVIFMLGILACLAFGYLATRAVKPTRKVRWFLQAPISLYFGWITIATVLNVASALYAMAIPLADISEFSGVVEASTSGLVATVVMICVSAGIAAVVAWQYKDATYPAVAVWGLVAIALRNTAISPIAFVSVAMAVGLCIIIAQIQRLARRPHHEPS
ncbi:MAG: tryptophan-rich sensory protein [Cyanobacteria bacterium J06621_11]